MSVVQEHVGVFCYKSNSDSIAWHVHVYALKLLTLGTALLLGTIDMDVKCDMVRWTNIRTSKVLYSKLSFLPFKLSNVSCMNTCLAVGHPVRYLACESHSRI